MSDDWKERQRRSEIEYGRRMSIINTFRENNALIRECKVTKPSRSNNNTWIVTVTVNVPGAEPIVDKFWEFPSDELKAMLMLLEASNPTR